jgi:hypothetical protein
MLFHQAFDAPPAHAQEPFASFDFTFGALYPAESAGGILLGGTLLKPLMQSGALKWELGLGGGFSHRSYQKLIWMGLDLCSIWVSASNRMLKNFD